MRAVVVTGAGQGLGRAHALAFGQAGYGVVVNDVGPAADAVVAEITAAGGAAVASIGDVSDWAYGERLVATAVEVFGGLDALVNNAGIVRDRMLVNLSESDWDDVMRINLKGHFVPLRHAATHWRNRSKAGEPVTGRVVNTSSGAGLMGNVSQANYAAAKAAVAALTIVAATELARYGVTVNAIAPSARTSMTEVVFADAMRRPEHGFDAAAPENVSPLVVWLCGEDAGDVNGRMFEVSGGQVSVTDGWQHGVPVDAGRRWEPAELGPVVRDLLAKAPAPAPVYGT
jgi:NAD(P)-dependent dehydrogenase (short-subunit alcohol dehydrogenase family)